MKISLKILIPIILSFLVIGIFLGQNLVNFSKVSPPSTEPEKNRQVQQEIVVGLTLDFGEGEIKTFNNIGLKEDKTVFALLKKVVKENNLELSFKEYPGLGVFIESIDNVANDAKNNKWWQYLVNNQYAQVGASNYQLKNGDFVEWKYIESQL